LQIVESKSEAASNEENESLQVTTKRIAKKVPTVYIILLISNNCIMDTGADAVVQH